MLNNENLNSETKNDQQIPSIRLFKFENGIDQMKQQIEANYKQVKLDVLSIIESELERIKNDSNLKQFI